MNKVFAVSDLHGQYELWRKVIESIDETDILYMLGDAADRGPDGWKIIKEALGDPRVRYIRGNHDQFILDAWRSDWCDTHLWFWNGGYETYDSIIQDENSEIYLTQLARTELYHCYENKNGQVIHLSHAGFTLMEDDVHISNEDLLWDREHCEDSCDWWPKENPNDYVVHGHTPVASSTFKRLSCFFPERYKINDSCSVVRYAHGHKICIDAGTFATGKVAILDLDTLQELTIENAK